MKLHVIAILSVFLAPIALHAAEPGASIRYQLDRDAVVSLNVTRPDGWVVRELLIAEKQAKGGHEVTWDGRDELGYPPVATFGGKTLPLLSHYDKQAMILDWIQRGEMQVAPLISHRLPARQVRQGYDGLLQNPETYSGVVLDWKA